MAASFLFTFLLCWSSASRNVPGKGYLEGKFCDLLYLKYLYSVLILECLDVGFWVRNNFPLKLWRPLPMVFWFGDAVKKAKTGMAWSMSPLPPQAYRILSFEISWWFIWCRLVFIHSSGCRIGSFSLETFCSSILGKLTFCLIVLSLLIFYFCFQNSYYSDIGSIRLWKFFCFSFWGSPSTFSSYEFLCICLLCVFYISSTCACACMYK